ncbi:hypothetical protein V6N13_048344 [Hibiscus sabdariffa]
MAGIWSLRVPQRIRLFMWLAAHRHHLTNLERVRRHLALSKECSLCQAGPKDIDHVLRFCERARDLWISVIPLWETDRFFTLPFEEWLHVNLQGSLMPKMLNERVYWRRDVSSLTSVKWLLCPLDPCRGLSHERQWHVQVDHINRDGNKVVDTLAVLERTQSMEGAIFAMPSDMVTGIVTDEKRYWDDHRRAAISPPQYYRRMDPRG